jgi:hypothetical protein
MVIISMGHEVCQQQAAKCMVGLVIKGCCFWLKQGSFSTINIIKERL